MKTVIAAIISLLLGVAVGWYGERRNSQREKTEIVQQAVEAGEASDREHALRAVRAIECIQAGDNQRAVQTLSTPIAHYYAVYTEAGKKEERRAETRALIEQLARTNQLVAGQIAEVSNNVSVGRP